MEAFFQVGVYANTHGVRGEIKVYPTTDDPKRFLRLKQVILQTKEGDKILEIAGVRFQKNMVLVKFRGIDDINEIEKYKGSPLLIPREEAIPLGKDEYYIPDLIGMSVYTESGERLGELTEVMQTGANDVYIVQTPKGEVLLPAIAECILDVDVESGRMLVHLMKGLVDE